MLQIMSQITNNNQRDYDENVDVFKFKCGEIFCNEIPELIIYCSVCKVESFRRIDEFLGHLRDTHTQIVDDWKSRVDLHDQIENISYDSTTECLEQLSNAIKVEETSNNVGVKEHDDNNDEITIEEFIWEEVPYLISTNISTISNVNDVDFLESEPLISLKCHKESHPVTRSSTKETLEEENTKGENDKVTKESLTIEHSKNGKDTNNDKVIKTKMKKITNKTICKYKCMYCDRQYKSQSRLNGHQVRHHPTIVKDNNNDFEERSKEIEEFQTKKNETGQSMTLEWHCSECLSTFNSKKLHHRHCIEEHDGFKCPLCEKRFRHLYQCKRHEHTHITEKTLMCSIEGCGKGFSDQYYLKRHLDVHKTDDRSFVCDFEDCKKSFYTQRRLLAHKKLHTKPKNLICDICGYCCREKETLRVHQRTHTGERPYPCTVCEKRFASSSSLAEHMASHASDRPHVCNVCNATFARQKALYHHSFLHLDFKKFKCKICGRAYRQAAGLSGHLRKHREENALIQPLVADVAKCFQQNTRRHKLLK